MCLPTFCLIAVLVAFAAIVHGRREQGHTNILVHMPTQHNSILKVVAASTEVNCHPWWARIPRCGSSTPTTDQKCVASKDDRQLPKLFQDTNDTRFDRYAACLAATEGLRRIRDQALLLQQQEQSHNHDNLKTKKNTREAKEWAIAMYVENASKVIEAMGMPVTEFNEIGREVCTDAALKQKVRPVSYL
jgi:Domain of unknown function (DUF4168)